MCQSAIGTPNCLYFSDYNAANLPKGKHSTKGCGRTVPDEKDYVKLDGMTVPKGKPKSSNTSQGHLMYNEYIVYDVAQLQIKYLLKCRFN